MSQIRKFPDPVLRKPALKVQTFDRKLIEIFEKMSKIMKTERHGIGIAAPQIGISKNMAIVDLSSRDPKTKAYWISNPKIIAKSEPIMSREGCMSVPNYMGNTKRYNRVRVRWQDFSGAYQEKDFSGIEAVCFQHEIDHLNGLLFLDRVSSLKVDMVPRSWKGRKKK